MEKINHPKSKPILLIIGLVIFLALLPLQKVSAIDLLKPFGGRILVIGPNIDPLCPAGANIIQVGLPKPITAIFTNGPWPLVKNGPAQIGAWALGLATPPVPPCLPVIFLIGVSKIF